MIDQKTLKYFLRYDPETGIFRWNHSPSFRAVKNSIAGCIDISCGYRKIRVAGKNYRAGRLAYLYMIGRWPDPQIDHINRIRDDDRWSNLREVTNSENQINKAPYGAVPFKGVYITNRRFIALITRDGKNKYLGCFKTPELASAAYQQAAKQ